MTLILVATLMGGTILLIWPRFIPTAWIETGVRAVVTGVLGRPITIGAVRVTRLGHIRLNEVVIWRDMERSAPLVRWESFDLAVKLLPLLRGKLAVERVSVNQPELFVQLTEEGRPALDLPMASAPAALGLLVGQASVRQGTVTLLNPDASPRLILRHVNFTGRLESLRGPFRFRIAFTVPDADDRAKVELEGTLSLAEGASAPTWEALLGTVSLSLEGLDWEEASVPEDLKRALAPLAVGLVRRADLHLTLARRSDEAVDVEVRFKAGQVRWKGQGGEPVELTDAALSVAGRYDVASGAVWLKRLHFSIPWMEAEVSGRLEQPQERISFDGSIRGKLTTDKLPRTVREALASQGVDFEGPITWEAALKADPERTAIEGFFELEPTAVTVAGLALKGSGEPARVAFDIERDGERWTIHRIALKSQNGETHLAGTVHWRPPRQTSVDLRVTSRARAEWLAERWDALRPTAPRAVTASGEITAEVTVRGLVEGLTLAGTLDATDVFLALDGREVKARGEPATVQAALELKKQTLVVRRAEVRLPEATASLRGKLSLQATRPRYDLQADLRIDADGLQRRLGDTILRLPEGVTVSGSLEAKATVTRFKRTLGLGLDVDATALEVHWGSEGAKTAGVPARLRFSGQLERGLELDQFRVDVGPMMMSFAGRVDEGWKTASLTYEGSVSDLASLPTLWRPLATQSLRGGVALRGILKWAEGRTAVHGSADFYNASLTLAGDPPVTLGLHGTITHSPSSFFTDRLLLTVDEQPITVTTTIERKASGLRGISLVKAGRIDLTNLWAHLASPTEAEDSSSGGSWGKLVAGAIKDGAQLHGRVQAEALRIAPYTLTDLDMEVTSARGVVRVPRLDFGLNGGKAHHTLTVDMTRHEPVVTTTIAWRGLGADPNLRPFLERVFPNLFVTGSMDFSARYVGSGADVAQVTETLEGTSTMVVHGGYLLSDPTPQKTRKVFPTLSLSHYAFERAHIETRTVAGRAHNIMRFEAPTINLRMRGWTDNRTGEIDYVMVVDLVENLGLGSFRNQIPDALESASELEIAHITGTLNEQKVEYLSPEVNKIKETLKSLLGLKALQRFLVEMSAEEKAAYLKGTVGSVLGAATKPFRYLTRTLNR